LVEGTPIAKGARAVLHNIAVMMKEPLILF